MAQIEVSDKTLVEFNKLLDELHKLYPQQKLNNDQIMEAMIGWFFDSLAYMQKQAEGHHEHHHHDHSHGECCWWKECDNDDRSCCGHHHEHA